MRQAAPTNNPDAVELIELPSAVSKVQVVSSAMIQTHGATN